MKDWTYTQEQASAIKSGDIAARNKFYFDNISRVKIMARKYCNSEANFDNRWTVEDIIQQFYLDIPYLDFSSGASLTCFTKMRSFKWSAYGGFSFLKETKSKFLCDHKNTSLDESLDSDSTSSRYDYIIDENSPNPENFEQATDHTKQIENLIKPYLSPRQYECMTHYLQGYEHSEIMRKMGIKGGSVYQRRAIERLRQNYLAIVSAIDCINSEATAQYIGITPSNNNYKRPCKTTLEEREKRAARTRAWRARQKQAKTIA